MNKLLLLIIYLSLFLSGTFSFAGTLDEFEADATNNRGYDVVNNREYDDVTNSGGYSSNNCKDCYDEFFEALFGELFSNLFEFAVETVLDATIYEGGRQSFYRVGLPSPVAHPMYKPKRREYGD